MTCQPARGSAQVRAIAEAAPGIADAIPPGMTRHASPRLTRRLRRAAIALAITGLVLLGQRVVPAAAAHRTTAAAGLSP